MKGLTVVEISDRQEREKALDISAHVHVESPAGAGKTGLIIERILALLSAVEHPSEILAMTFTRKAAAEMKGRVLEILKAADEGVKSGDPYTDSLIEKARKVIGNYRGLQREMLLAGSELHVTTIHSFCLNICKRAPLESGLEPWLRLADEKEQERLRELASEEIILDLLKRDRYDPFRKALRSRLLMHNMDVRGLASEIASLLAKRDQLGELLSALGRGVNVSFFIEKSKQNLANVVRMHLAKLEEMLKDSLIGRQWADFRDYLVRSNAPCLDKIPESRPSAHWRDLKWWLGLSDVFLTAGGTIRRRWGPRYGGVPGDFSSTPWAKALMSLGEEFQNYLAELRYYPKPEALGEEISAVEDLVLIISAALDKYREICRAENVIDYVDLELGALKALDSVQDVTESILFWDRKIRHILIDEFQDTSATEYMLLERLINGWEDGDGRTLFLVGDPKQSIYRFRKADVSVFYRAEKGIERSGLGPLTPVAIKLKTNFRSRRKLIEWTNDLFGKTVMAAPRLEYDEVRFIDAVAAAPGENTEENPELALFIKKGNEPGSSARKREASYLACRVEARLNELKSGETIGVLLFTRTHLPAYLKAFKDAGVPLQVQEGLKLSEIPGVAHMANLTRAVVRPHDLLSWVASLRSPWLTVPISVVKDILDTEGDTLFEKIKTFESGNEDIERFYRAMVKARSRLGRDNLGDVVKSAWVELGGPERVASFFGIAGVNACLRFLDRLFECKKGSPEETLEEMNFFLESAYDPVDITAADSPVFLMTVHGAKGLEFDHCFIPWLDYSPLKTGGGDKPAYLSSVIGGASLIASRPDRRVTKENSVYDFLSRIERRKLIAEAKRLFYVAATRAKKTIFMSGVWNGKSSPEGPLKWVLSHLGIKKLTDDFVEGEIGSTLVLIDPAGKTGEKSPGTTEEIPLSEPSVFNPEHLPYRVKKPSDEGEHHRADGDSAKLLKARGTVIHKVIEQLAMGLKLPNKKYIERLLQELGVDLEKSVEIAADIRVELEKCLEDPFFRWITNSDNFEWAETEWAVEFPENENVIVSGVIDRVLFDGKYYWVIDYKSHKPHENETAAEFEERMKRSYASQLDAYRNFVARVREVDKKCIKCGLYLTSVSSWVEL